MRRNETLGNQLCNLEKESCKPSVLYSAFVFLNTLTPTIINATAASLGKELVTTLKWDFAKDVSEKEAVASASYGSMIVFFMMSAVFAAWVWHHARQRQQLFNQLLQFFNATMGINASAGAFLVSSGFHWVSNKIQGNDESLYQSVKIGTITQLPALALIILGYFSYLGGKIIKNCCDQCGSKNEENSAITLTADSINPLEQQPESPHTAIVIPNLSRTEKVKDTLFYHRALRTTEKQLIQQHRRTQTSDI